MKSVLCYGDSHVWGYIPGGGRYATDTRWTGRLSFLLGQEHKVIEEGLNGRTTDIDDPRVSGRNGFDDLAGVLKTHSFADLIIIMLGTNDMNARFNRTSSDISMSMLKLINFVKTFDSNIADIILISPPKIINSKDKAMNQEFAGAIAKSATLASKYRDVANRVGCQFIDACEYCESSIEDGIHMNAANHLRLADGVLDKINELSL